MPKNEEEKNKLAAEKALLEQKEIQSLINRGFEVEKPVVRKEKKEFYIAPLQKLQNKKKEKTNEEEPEKVAICWRGVCIPVSMDLNTAQKFCDAANELLNSKHMEDRLKVEKAWDLLAKGNDQEALNMLLLEVKNKRERDLEIMLKNKEENNKLGSEKALLEEKKIQPLINREFEVEKPVIKEDKKSKFKLMFPDGEHWKKILQKYKEKFPDEKSDEDGCLRFPSPKAAETFFRELAADKVEFLTTELVGGKPIDNHMFSCGTGTMYHGSFKDIHNQLIEALKIEKNPELMAKLSKGIEMISHFMPKENATISIKDRLRDYLPQKSDAEREESTLPNPLNIKPKPNGFV